MQTAKSSSNDNITMPITFLLTDNTTKSYQTIFNDGFYQYITSASALKNSTRNDFVTASEVSIT